MELSTRDSKLRLVRLGTVLYCCGSGSRREFASLDYLPHFLSIGLGVDRVCVDTSTVFGPGFPVTSGRQIVFDIAFTSFQGHLPRRRACDSDEEKRRLPISRLHHSRERVQRKATPPSSPAANTHTSPPMLALASLA
jgi:hypothetical protein